MVGMSAFEGARGGTKKGAMSEVKKYSKGGAITFEEFMAGEKIRHTIEIDEGQRQSILLALAELSIGRPGWVHMLNEIALKMDNTTPEGNAEMFEEFRQLHTQQLRELLLR